MRRVRVCIYGGTDLQGSPPKFVSALAYEVLNAMPAVIVTGGFRHSHRKPNATSTDVAALEGAQRYSLERAVDLRECFEAWVPEPSLDSRPDVSGVVRMTADDGITLRVITGRTPLGRRLAMVGDVDVVVTISGKTHTEVVIEQALDLGIPVLPIPYAGGDSRAMLKAHRSKIETYFSPGALDDCLRVVSTTMKSEPSTAAKAVVSLVETARIGKCLVLLPYDEYHNRLYSSTIEPAISKYMVPIRLDQIPKSAAIYASFADAITTSAAVIADISMLNENVMYEVGYAHGRGLEPLIYATDPSRLDRLPIYFRTLNVHAATDATQVERLIDEYLRSIRSARGPALAIT